MRGGVLFLAVAGILAGAPAASHAYCVPFSCDDCTLRSEGQVTLVAMDHDRGKVVMIPNIRLVGRAGNFALVVPTPGLPRLSEAEVVIWDQAFALTAGLRTTRFGGDFGCGGGTDVAFFTGSSDVGADENGGGVRVHGYQSVGAMEAVILSSDSPDALASWLRDQGFPFTAEDAARFAPYVDRDWFFTAMRPAGNPSVRTWDNNVDPVAFTFDADTFEVPMPVLGGPGTNDMVMAFFVVDDYRTHLEGFRTVYANHLSDGEMHAIRSRYPSLARYLDVGRVFTRLDRTLVPESDYSRSVPLVRAEDQSEIRRVDGTPRRASLPGFLAVTGALCWFLARWAGGRRRRAA